MKVMPTMTISRDAKRPYFLSFLLDFQSIFYISIKKNVVYKWLSNTLDGKLFNTLHKINHSSMVKY